MRMLKVYVFHLKNDAVFVKFVDDHSAAKLSIGNTVTHIYIYIYSYVATR